jgi:hypothetical protein
MALIIWIPATLHIRKGYNDGGAIDDGVRDTNAVIIKKYR